MKRIVLAVGVAILAAAPSAMAQKFEQLAQTPPMGWNSWNHFGCDVTEELIRETADAMVTSGMRDAGYLYVNIDDCWHGERDKDGFIQPNPERFPSGMKALADYVHSKGLKLGIYSDAGWRTCAPSSKYLTRGLRCLRRIFEPSTRASSGDTVPSVQISRMSRS